MKLLLLCFAAGAFLVLSCDNNTTGSKNYAATSDTGQTQTTPVADTIPSTDKNIPLEKVGNKDALEWIKDYQSKMPLIGQKRIPNMIWLSNGHGMAIFNRASKLKICFALDTNKLVTPLLQVKLKGTATYEYYRLKAYEKEALEESSFCPLPYPCAVSIEESTVDN